MAKRKQTSRPSERLFADDQIDMFEKSYAEQLKEEKNRPVECLGMTFENDEKRREYFLDKLRDKLKDPEFRKIEGFPIGEDDDILALSDPPYYTAWPKTSGIMASGCMMRQKGALGIFISRSSCQRNMAGVRLLLSLGCGRGPLSVLIRFVGRSAPLDVCALPYALFALRPLLHALCPSPSAPCPMPFALCPLRCLFPR